MVTRDGPAKSCMSGSSVKVFWDTNIWVYLFDAGSPAKQDQIRGCLKRGRDEIITSTQVLQEFYVTVTRKLAVPLDEERAAAVLPGLAEFCTVLVDVQMICSAADLARQHSFSFWDALIVEAAHSGGATTLYSEDLQHGRVVRGVTIRNPFAEPRVGS